MADSFQIPISKLTEPALVVSSLRVSFSKEQLLKFEKRLRKSEKSMIGPLLPYATVTLDLPEQTRQTWFDCKEEEDDGVAAFSWSEQEMLL